MNNNGSSNPHGYQNPPYGYSQSPPSQPYPPSSPGGGDPPAHLLPYPYPYGYSPYPYSRHSPSPPSSGPLDYARTQSPSNYTYHPPCPQSTSYPVPNPYPCYPPPPPLLQNLPPRPAHQHHYSFPYASPHYNYQQVQPQSYPPPEKQSTAHSRANSVSVLCRQDNIASCNNQQVQPPSDPPPEDQSLAHSGASSNSVLCRPDNIISANYDCPPLDGLMSNVQLSDNQPTAPASPPAPAAQENLVQSMSVPKLERTEGFCAYPNSSSSGRGSAYSDLVDSSKNSAYPYMLDDSLNSQSTQIVPLQDKGSLKVLLLHGNLDIWVQGAKDLPNMDMFHKTLGDMFGRKPGNGGKEFDGSVSRKITSDPYVTISIANAVIGRTFVISNSENPVWMQHFHVPVAHNAAEVHFVVKDSDIVGSQLIGTVAIPVEQIYSGAKIEGAYPILNNYGKPCKPGAVLSLSIRYIPIEKLSMYQQGVGAGPDYLGVPGTYFPLRKGGTVKLYQDAHVPDGCLPNVVLDQGSYVHGKCWRDIFDAIRQARRLIYITGWSVWHKVTMIRDEGDPSDSCLGDILRLKSQEGVRVLLLIWDDPTSRSILGYKTDGIMATHDEETRRFFKHSSVQVILCPRTGVKRHSWVKQKEVGTIYTHHQKTVIVDADAGNNRRKIIAFVGGLDLCDGRYDTPHHPIFRTLQTVHKDDYHNPTYTGSVGGCPREPWHDLHSKIDGPAAYDVLTNFEERWVKAAKPQGLKKLNLKVREDALLRLDRIPDVMSLSEASRCSDNDPEAWHVQIFRSIDSSSVKGFPKDPKEATYKNLVSGKNVLIDMSIHTAYVKAIRAAQHYIYIENQYFIGSSYNWRQYKDLGANNLIPMEIALKIAEKIRANERFAVYIVIPMWPEGVPTGAATQRILFWQHKTMQMMYQTIYKALVGMGLEAAFSPQDYLNFFCLGNREVTDMYYYDSAMGGPPSQAVNSPRSNSRRSRRFMIYVHSKGLIVDDEYVILGSANINQRSMEGTRDTEIAMGAYQPNHTWEGNQAYPRGQIHRYRMSLWAEHTGTIEECFLQPESLECVRRLRTMGEMNWRQFAANEVTEMRGHLLKYPVEVDRKGKVRSLPGHEEFPDVGGKIVGSFTAIQENLTI